MNFNVTGRSNKGRSNKFFTRTSHADCEIILKVTLTIRFFVFDGSHSMKMSFYCILTHPGNISSLDSHGLKHMWGPTVTYNVS